MTDLPLPPQTRYDQAARYLLAQTGGAFFQWALNRTAEQLRFDRWLSPQLTLPGVRQRLCDGVAALADLKDNGRPFAAILEVQTTPDFSMPGRLLIAGGLVWLTLKPTELPGDRYELVGLILNLTGVGNGSRRSILGGTEWKLKPKELNFENLDASKLLRQIGKGTAPWQLLAFIPLLKRGGEPGIIDRWRQLVMALENPQQRGDCGLAQVFAERVNLGEVWSTVMEEITFIESPMIGTLLAEARTKARTEAEARVRAATLLRLLRRRLETLPDSLVKSIEACTDVNLLDGWIDAAADATSLEQFRQTANL